MSLAATQATDVISIADSPSTESLSRLSTSSDEGSESSRDLESPTPEESKFNIISEKVGYKRYMKVMHRVIQYPDGREVDYDVVRRPDFVVIIPFDSQTKTFTMIQEMCCGAADLLYGFPCGGFEADKHTSMQDVAEFELNEEVQLTGGTFIPLLPPSSKGCLEVKWGAGRMFPYLCIDPRRATKGEQREQDDEEYIVVHRNMPVKRAKELLCSGQMILHTSTALFIALEYLRREGYLGDNEV